MTLTQKESSQLDAQTASDAAGTESVGKAMDMKIVRIVFPILLLTMLISSLGQMIFSTALPTIVGELGGVEHMSWVITGFLLGQTIAMPIVGKLGDMVGRKNLFIFGISLFGLGSLLGAVAQSMPLLILARAMQGVAGGTLTVTDQAITAEIIPARQRGKFMGYMGAAFAIASVLGPILGGWFTSGIGWRWAMWMNVPLSIIAIVGAAIFLKLERRGSAKGFDWLGTVCMAVATSCLILATTWGGNLYDWTSPIIIVLILAVIVAGAAFVFAEKHAKHPLVPMALFTNRNFALTAVAGLVLGMGMFGLMGYMPTYLQMSHLLEPSKAGLMMTPMVVGMMATSILIGNIVTRTGKYKWYPVVGLLIAGLAMIPLSRLHADDPLWYIGIFTFAMGFGIGMAMQVLVLTVQNSFSISMVGTATASNNFFRQVGAALGASVVGGLFSSRLAAKMVGVELTLQAGGMGQAAADAGFSTTNITPSLLKTLPDSFQHLITTAYNDAFTPIFLVVAPLLIIGAAFAFGVREERLKEVIS